MSATALPDAAQTRTVDFHGGVSGALAPFALFVVGVVWLGLSGAPDERGFWPVLVAALSLGLLLARDRTAYSEAVIAGMSRQIVMIMVMAWLLASVLGVLLSATGFIEALAWTAARLGLGPVMFVGATFFACVGVSTATGTSFGTILIAGPLLYPAGVLIGADPATTIGAILGGAVFGDSISPISDTTIASAFSQNADIAGTVRSRLKYVVVAGVLSLAAYLVSAALSSRPAHTANPSRHHRLHVSVRVAILHPCDPCRGRDRWSRRSRRASRRSSLDRTP